MYVPHIQFPPSMAPAITLHRSASSLLRSAGSWARSVNSIPHRTATPADRRAGARCVELLGSQNFPGNRPTRLFVSNQLSIKSAALNLSLLPKCPPLSNSPFRPPISEFRNSRKGLNYSCGPVRKAPDSRHLPAGQFCLSISTRRELSPGCTQSWFRRTLADLDRKFLNFDSRSSVTHLQCKFE